ncbi:tRNA (guanosine(37)-N1)-methyltransferase TrmD [Hyphomicrobiales bacterium]|nr:tRNA (guanosine(37)-N1)-methyltransferase TrmD [Hyphomicrobiales bacterium]MDC0139353.1 tRNA (guanosine(37)-N1)-methyltransferase TrmD [Hyphomicrobiales bacterium]
MSVKKIDKENDSWTASVLTVTPEVFPGTLGVSNAGKSLKDGLWNLDIHDIKEYANIENLRADGPPAGGGPGMILRADVILPIIDIIKTKADRRPIMVMTPRGKVFNQLDAKKYSSGAGVIIICGRYEGIDQRVVDSVGALEVSIGDMVLSSGDIAASLVIDSCVRLIDGVMGKKESSFEESFENGLLEYPQYTLPRSYGEHEIPDILLSGNHEKIKKWRIEKSINTTKNNRPDLWRKYLKSD